ncbi:hypothetical protein [Arhodomonas sp. AD133]|uniref:hypothetical protein n=1 Tax=Arhodomonas sp. AD133 TaxID=3415009 RepID=UPI003EBE84A8
MSDVTDRDKKIIEIMARAMDRRDGIDVTYHMRCESALEALRAAGYMVESDGLMRTEQHLAEDYRRLLGDLFQLRDAHVRKSSQDRADADDRCAVINAAWAAARQEFAADLHALIWGEPAPTVAAAALRAEREKLSDWRCPACGAVGLTPTSWGEPRASEDGTLYVPTESEQRALESALDASREVVHEPTGREGQNG